MYDKMAIYRKCQKINMCLRLKKEITSKIREGKRGKKCKIKLWKLKESHQKMNKIERKKCAAEQVRWTKL